MPLSHNGVDLFVWNLRTQSQINHLSYGHYTNFITDLVETLLKFIFTSNIFETICLTSSKGIPQRQRYYGSLDDTVITIEADESTPLLVDRLIWPDNNNNGNISSDYVSSIDIKRKFQKYGGSSWSFESSRSSQHSSDSDYSAFSTKSFKSHFTELRVLAFALILVAALSIAIYLLVIESRLPSVTLSLDLVSHDIWSQKSLAKHLLQHNNVDHIILMQTGSSNCDTSGECLKILKEMQDKSLNAPEELPYNFLIGGDGQAYEVRGWQYQSSIKGIPQQHSLVIGIIGNFDELAPKRILLQTIQSLIQASLKRRMIDRNYSIYGLRHNDHNRYEGHELFEEVMNLPNFAGFLTMS